MSRPNEVEPNNSYKFDVFEDPDRATTTHEDVLWQNGTSRAHKGMKPGRSVPLFSSRYNSITPLQMYLTEIAEYDLLTREQEQSLGLDMEVQDTLAALTEQFEKENGFMPTARDMQKEILLNIAKLDSISGAVAYFLGADLNDPASIDQDETRVYIDGPLADELVSAVAEILDINTEEANMKLRALSTLTRILPPELRDPDVRETELSDKFAQIVTSGNIARNTMIEANQRLTVSIAKMFQSRGVEIDDLIQMGNLGLIKAVEKFDFRKGFKFSTYAPWWIQQSIRRGIGDFGRTVRMPVHVEEIAHKLPHFEAAFMEKHGRVPNAKEIALGLGASETIITSVLANRYNPVSLDQTVSDDSSRQTSLAEFISDNRVDVESEVVKRLRKQEIKDVLSGLREREQTVIKLGFGLDGNNAHTLEQVGNILNVTRERVRQIELRALKRLKSPASKAKLAGLLDD